MPLRCPKISCKKLVFKRIHKWPFQEPWGIRKVTEGHTLTLEPSQRLVLKSLVPCLCALCMEEQLLDRLCWWCIIQCLGCKAFKSFRLEKRRNKCQVGQECKPPKVIGQSKLDGMLCSNKHSTFNKHLYASAKEATNYCELWNVSSSQTC